MKSGRTVLVVGRTPVAAVDRHHIDAVTGLIKNDFAIHQRKQSPIATSTNVAACHKLRPALANQNAAGRDKFSAKAFYAQPFADTISSVSDASLTFLVSHNLKL